MKSNNKTIIFIVIFFVTILILSIVMAPFSSRLETGSTYNRSPEGYGAWYDYMQKQGAFIQRWKKPFTDLPDFDESNSLNGIKAPVTLIQIYPVLQPELIPQFKRSWVEEGNKLIILAIRQPVDNVPFTSYHSTEQGLVKVETRRRKEVFFRGENLLGDESKPVVWSEKIGKGKLILATAPDLAANAYQDEPGNFKFLASLVTGEGKPQILVDEYIHGYRESKNTTSQEDPDLLSYLGNTPVAIAVFQGLILLMVLIYGFNKRFGQVILLKPPQVDNTSAYVEAIAQVLEKAQCRDFVIDVIGREEKIKLQKSLGLGSNIVEDSTLINTWVQQTQDTSQELSELLAWSKQNRITSSQLRSYLEKWQKIHSRISFK